MLNEVGQGVIQDKARIPTHCVKFWNKINVYKMWQLRAAKLRLELSVRIFPQQVKAIPEAPKIPKLIF